MCLAVSSPPPLPLEHLAAGGELRTAQPEWFPLAIEHRAGSPSPAVPPVPCALAAAPHGWVASSTCSRPVQPQTPHRYTQDPTLATDVRAILAKTAGQGWEAVVRYGITAPTRGPLTRRRLRGRAHALASAFGLFDGRNRLGRHRVRRPAAVMAARRLRRGDLLSVAELAASRTCRPTRSCPALPGLARGTSSSAAGAGPGRRPGAEQAARILLAPRSSARWWQAARPASILAKCSMVASCSPASPGQLPRELREAISANARSKLIVAVSPEDASALERDVCGPGAPPRPTRCGPGRRRRWWS